MSEQCRSCDAPVLWGRNPLTNSRVILDAEPVAGGNIVIDRHDEDGVPLVRYLRKHEINMPMLFGGKPRYVSHFATCPHSGSWRRGKVPSRTQLRHLTPNPKGTAE